jgi:lipopolysaccharide biosynthesis regulator YciM
MAMAKQSNSKPELDYHEAKGAYDILVTLREEFEQWLEEAEDDSKKEELENVLSHVVAMEDEYKARSEKLERQLSKQ